MEGSSLNWSILGGAGSVGFATCYDYFGAGWKIDFGSNGSGMWFCFFLREERSKGFDLRVEMGQ